jgi:CheY-like chemotaxis protein
MNAVSRNVLIVDDDPLVAATLQRVLVDRGHRASSVLDGRAALKLLAQEKFDFVLVDVFMPDKDGIETLREVKRKYPTITVGVASGGGLRGRFEFLDMALKFGADGIAQKPITPDSLFAMVERKEFPTTSKR